MKHFLGAYILLFFTIIGCSNDDDGAMTNPDVDLSGIMGTWNLSNVSGGFVGIDHDFENGTIVWEFDEVNKKVVIVNNNTDDAVEDILPSGTYDYSIISVNGNQEFIINGVNKGTIEIVNTQFTISENFRDGFRFEFNR